MTTESNIQTLLNNYFDSYLQKTWGEVKAVKQWKQADGVLTADITLGYPVLGLEPSLFESLKKSLLAIPGIREVCLQFTAQIQAHATQPTLQPLAQVKNIIAVGSGKGGVGKSTTAANIAAALSLQGVKTGILDADIYGPNQSQMLGIKQKIIPEDGKPLQPVYAHGMQTMSMAYLIDTNTPMIWRGPMVSSALQQLIQNTAWQALDYLIVDLPPGTGDIQLTLSQKIPVAGAVIVTTPQDIALLDARKGLEMFRKVNVPILGIIENMSAYICSVCGHHEALFGEGGAERLIRSTETELLGQVPLVKSIREQADAGVPIVLAMPDSDAAVTYQHIARRIAAKLSLQPKNHNSKFPKIVVENS